MELQRILGTDTGKAAFYKADDNFQVIKNEMENLSGDAVDINFNNAESGMTATNVQDAIDEVDVKTNNNTEQINNFAPHLTQAFSKVVLVTEPFNQVTKTTINLGFRPKWVHIKGIILSTNYESDGYATVAGDQHVSYREITPNNLIASGGIIVRFSNDYQNNISGVVAFTDTGIEITWTITGSTAGMSGNRRLIISALTH